jgi:hypothetical protein
MVLPEAVTGKAGEVGVEGLAGAFFTTKWELTVVVVGGVLASGWGRGYLQGGRQVLTLKSLRRTNQYMPHYSGRVGTNMNLLHSHSLQAVLTFLPKYVSLCASSLWLQKHLECLPNLEHSDFFCSFQYVI